MGQKSMTALVSAFSRAYHSLNNDVKVFDDSVARLLLSDEEYRQIAKSMSDGITFFNPSFKGNSEEALRWIVDNQLSPSPIGRAAFAQKALKQAVDDGAEQYLIFGAGYDTFAYRLPKWAEALEIFEIDHPATARDKQERLKAAGIFVPHNVHYAEADFTKADWQNALQESNAFDGKKVSCCTILGVAYYLSRDVFKSVLSVIGNIGAKGSTVVFDYPDENSYTENAGERAKKQNMLATAANEKMMASYSYGEIECLLNDCGFCISEHLTPREMTAQYFDAYNKANPTHIISAFDNVNYCCAVKK